MIVGVVADTHVPTRARALPPELLDALAGVEWILHAGDLCTLDVIRVLRAIAPVEAVAGNMDPPEVAQVLGERRELELGGVRIGLAHGHVGRGGTTRDRARNWFPEAQVVVYGHSHLSEIEMVADQLILNPGSPTHPAGGRRCSCARLVVESGAATAELVEW